MVLCKLSQVLVHIEYDGDGDNQCYGINIGADKLLDDVPVKEFDVAFWAKVFEPPRPFCHQSHSL